MDERMKVLNSIPGTTGQEILDNLDFDEDAALAKLNMPLPPRPIQ